MASAMADLRSDFWASVSLGIRMADMQGRVALVTGASSGIGRATAEALSRDQKAAARHTRATRKQTARPSTSGNRAESVVHFTLRVSFQIV